MKITKEKIKELQPCIEAWQWYLEEDRTEDLEELLLITNKKNPAWSRWLFTKLMTLNQKREIAIFCAEQVIDIFEKKYPDDARPRKAIDAAKKVLESDTPENRKAAAAAAAYAAAAAAAAAAYSAYAAAYAAAAAAYSADAAAAYSADAAAAYSAYSADAIDAIDAIDAMLELQEKIIKKAVRILERNNEKL